jgi:hypothetical protein
MVDLSIVFCNPVYDILGGSHLVLTCPDHTLGPKNQALMVYTTEKNHLYGELGNGDIVLPTYPYFIVPDPKRMVDLLPPSSSSACSRTTAPRLRQASPDDCPNVVKGISFCQSEGTN